MAFPIDSFIVSVRGNDDLNPLGGKVLNKKILAITEEENERTMSSTAVKIALRTDEPINSIVSEPVIAIIEKYGLYR